MSESRGEQQVDHKAEAELAGAQAGQYFGNELDRPAKTAAAIGQVHASLAIAEQLERLNDKLGSVIGKSAKEPFGSKRYHVRTGK